MIQPKVIQQKARKAKVRDSQIEKDYVLTWILYGISQQSNLYNVLSFKGGTVLKKVYFEDYRYSEDLDFTLLDDQITDHLILGSFREVFNWVLAKTNLDLAIIKNHIHASGSLNFQVSYKGPLGGQGSSKRLKVDITRGERLAFTPVIKKVFNIYEDLTNFSLQCYPLEEVLIEKMCALMGRTEPRDLYDLWYLLEIAKLESMDYWREFTQKAHHKGHNPNKFTVRVEEKMLSFKARWESSLSAQIHFLPLFNQVTRDLSKHLQKLKSLEVS
jgi:uncharacterized protein